MTEQETGRYKIVPGSRRPDRLPMLIRPLILTDADLAAEMGAWLALNGVERPLAERGVVIGVESITFWRSGFDPLGPPTPMGIRFDGGVAYARDVAYDLRIHRQPGRPLLESLVAAGALRCSATSTLLDMDTGEAKPLECEKLVDVRGRHPGGHERLAGLVTYGWENHSEAPSQSPTLDAEAHEWHAAGMVRALAIVDRAMGRVSWHATAGVPLVGREAMFAAVGQAARECLGDRWAADMRVACDALRAEETGA
jgi:hypothetical protein